MSAERRSSLPRWTACAPGHANTITVAAGDLIGASPLDSAYFLDEPTIDAMNLLGLSVASVGNHEFDKGSGRADADAARRLREIHDARAVRGSSRSRGARFHYLAANVFAATDASIFPATAIRQVGPITDRLHRR